MLSLLLAFIAAACFIIYKTRGIFWGRNRAADEPPLVPGHPIWGNGKDFDQDSIGFILKAQKEHGSVFTMRMLHYHTTVIADPHSFEAFSKEKSFDFDPIQVQVNSNIFGFQIPESRKMIKFVGKTTRGSAVPKNLQAFSIILDEAFNGIESKPEMWSEESLDHLANDTLFRAIFNSIFGADKTTAEFNHSVFHDQFRVFHKYFSYLWLGLPHCFFPEATKAVGKLFSQPTPEEFMASEQTSDYLKSAIEFLKSYDLTDQEIKCHNLVFMHININTFKIAVWCLYQLMANKAAMSGVRVEIEEMCQELADDDSDVVLTAKDVETMPKLDSLIQECFRMSSGVFMIRHNQQDVNFTATSSGEKYKIRAGDKIMMYPPAIHKDPEIFEKPEEFQYDRFVNKSFYKSGQLLKNPILPFGSICPGRKIALLQVKYYLISMLNRYDLELLDGESCDFDLSYPGHEIVPPTRDVKLRYMPRKNSYNISVQQL